MRVFSLLTEHRPQLTFYRLNSVLSQFLRYNLKKGSYRPPTIRFGTTGILLDDLFLFYNQNFLSTVLHRAH